MTSPAAPDYLELSDYLSVLRRRWLTVALLTCAGVVLAAAYIVIAPPAYTATVLVQVNALPDNANAVGGRTAGAVNMDNEAQVLKSAVVASIVKSRQRSSMSVADISQEIKVTVPPNSTFLQITVPAPTAAAAQRWANTVGQVYLSNRRLSAEALIGSGIKTLQDRATKLSSTIERLKIIIASTRRQSRNPATSPVLVSDGLRLATSIAALTSVQAHIASAVPLYASLSTPHSIIAGSIVTPAALPTSPSSPRKLLVLPSGLVAGLILGMALAFIVDRRNKRVHSARDVERLGAAPILLSLTAPGQGPVTGLESPRSRAGQAFSELARSVAATLGDGRHVLVVAATSAGASGSVVTANLAAALARTSDETVVICGDVQGTMVPELLGTGRGRGLSEVLAGSAAATEIASLAPGLPRLHVISPGLDPFGVSAVDHAAASRLVTDLLEPARYVIFEVQSVGENGATFSLAEFAQAAILAVETGRSRPAEVSDCLQRLDRLGSPVLGAAILPSSASAPRRKKARVSQKRPEPAARPDDADQPGRASVHAQAAGAFTWPPGGTPAGPPAGTPAAPPAGPRASGEIPAYSSVSEPRRASETWPMPKVPAAARDGYLDPVDPPTQD